MPMPRRLFMRGSSGSATGIPKISFDSSAASARTRMLDPQAGQGAASRPKPSAGASQDAPQTLQMNFAESEHFKRGSPVTIVDGGDRHFFVADVGGALIDLGAQQGRELQSLWMGDEQGSRPLDHS